jgi:hypothetical protein
METVSREQVGSGELALGAARCRRRSGSWSARKSVWLLEDPSELASGP